MRYRHNAEPQRSSRSDLEVPFPTRGAAARAGASAAAGQPGLRRVRALRGVLERKLNAGQYLPRRPRVAARGAARRDRDAWSSTTLLHAVSPILAWGWNIAVLYLTMGFRQFSHYFTRDRARAARTATSRRHATTSRAGAARARRSSRRPKSRASSIELALVGSHRHVFGPIAWFLVLGPAGAVVYRAVRDARRRRGGASASRRSASSAVFAQRFFFWYDWVPARLTAASFAVVGNFEDAVYCWRTQARVVDRRRRRASCSRPAAARSACASAMRCTRTAASSSGPSSGLGDEADVDYMQSAIGLIWRALVLWMFLVFVVTVAHSWDRRFRCDPEAQRSSLRCGVALVITGVARAPCRGTPSTTTRCR